ASDEPWMARERAMGMTDHMGALLSALIDGELTADEVAPVEAHIRDCADCQAERDAVIQAKAMLRALPMLDPPFGMIDRLVIAERRRVRAVAARKPLAIASGAAAAAAFVLLALVPGQERTVTPPVDNFVLALATTVSSSGDSVTWLAHVAVPVSFGK